MRTSLAGWMVAGFATLALAQEATRTVLEAERFTAPEAEVFRDGRASDGQCAGVILRKPEPPFRPQSLLAASAELPAGDYRAEFWLEVTPVDVIHHLAVTLEIGDASITLNQALFDARQGYHAFEVRFFHPGGALNARIHAVGGSGFGGMRAGMSAQEQAGLPSGALAGLAGETPSTDEGDDGEDPPDGLETVRSVKRLTPFEHRVLCDRVEIRLERPAPAAVTGVEVDKIHYLPWEKVKAEATVRAPGAGFELVAEEIVELDAAREVFRQRLSSGATPQKVAFEYKLSDAEFGHELRCSLVRDGKVNHARGALFGVSRNVYRIGIVGNCGGGPTGAGDTRDLTAEQAEQFMLKNKLAYANYFEKFAWAPDDYAGFAPESEYFWSGQTQYPGSISGLRNLLRAAHQVGVKGMAYLASYATGIEGFRTFQRHPEFFRHDADGPETMAMNVFFLERMIANDYFGGPPSQGGWNHMAGVWTNWRVKGCVEHSAQAMIKSVEMFGWDGVRWDAQFHGRQKPFIDMLNARFPNFVHGYNISFANPGSALFLPPDTDHFPTVAANHGMLMDESLRNWSHSNFSPGHVRPFYDAICREADYEKRIGGLPLFIAFDMASPQDHTFNVLFGLAAGQRYINVAKLSDFPFGSIQKFLTRYSAFVWDDTRRIGKPESVIAVTVDGRPAATPWWNESVWLREAAGRQQLLVNLVNPPGYDVFASRVQTPAQTVADLAVRVITPPGARLARAFHISPDLAEGHVLLAPENDATAARVTLPRMRRWSIVGFEYEGGPKPLFALTTPIEDAAAALRENAEKEAKKVAEQKAKAGIGEAPAKEGPSYYEDYASHANADLEAEKSIVKPDGLALVRNGALDMHHARGAFSWLNPLEGVAALLDAATYTPSWVDFAGFKETPKGSMDDFPDSYEKLMGYDVLVLDNLHARHLGARNRVMIADFVRLGGGLLYVGGYFNLSLGGDHNTYLEALLPVTIAGYRQIVRDDKGLALKAEKPTFFDKVDWSVSLQAFTVDVSPLKQDADVLATAGGRPAIVSCRYGKGRVVAILINAHGDYPPEAKPYWLSSQWPRILAACVRWLAEDAGQTAAKAVAPRPIDATKIKPDDLAMDALDLSSKDFTAKLRDARANMVDANSARTLLETAAENADKIEDMELLADVVDEASAYFDKSMAPLGKRLSEASLDLMRQVGYQILGLAGDPKYRGTLEQGLEERNGDLAREALIGLGRIDDPASIAPVRRYLAQGGIEKLLALTVLVRLREPGALREALPAYAEGLRRQVRLKCGRGALIETLWGGNAFTLTPAARKQAMSEYRRHLRAEKRAAFDVQYFAASLKSPADEDLKTIAEFLAGCEWREALPLAYAVFSRLPPERAEPYRTLLSKAKLAELRLLAKD